MLKFFKAENGMNIVGQGFKIILFTVPSAVLAVFLHIRTPTLVNLQISSLVLMPIGVGFLVVGFMLWLFAILQLFIGFAQGKLLTTGAYRICRNPIYSSFALFLLPGISLLSGTWVYLCVSLFLCVGVLVFIRKEEQQLGHVFGNEYEAYKRRVSRIIPFLKPFHSKYHP